MPSHRAARVLLLSTVVLLVLATIAYTPQRVAADGGDATPGTPRRAANAVALGDQHSCVIVDAGEVKCWGDNAFGQLGRGDTIDRGDDAGEMGAQLTSVDLGTGRSAVSLAAGLAHSCAILDDGTVKCWGSNSSGQLGVGDTANRGDAPGEMGDNLPTVHLGVGRTALALAAGGEHTCALLDDGSVRCWGDNARGQLGVGDTVDRGDGMNKNAGAVSPAVDLGTGRTALSLTAGASHTCAVLDTHQLKCWGNNEYGQLGLGDTAHRGDGPGEMGDALLAIDLGTGRTTLHVSAGRFHTCAALDNNVTRCFGLNSAGQLAVGAADNRGDGPGEMGDALPGIDHSTYGTVVAVASTAASSCVLYQTGGARCWGENDSGQLGYGNTVDQGAQPWFSGSSLTGWDVGFTGSPVVSIAGGYAHMCVVSAAGTVKCHGANDSGQLGYGHTMTLGDGPGELSYGQPTVALRSFVTADSVQATTSASCALLSDGHIKCWGSNALGWLGTGDTTSYDMPAEMGENLPAVDLGAGRTATEFASAYGTSCAILDNQALKCWGDNAFGQLGYGDKNTRGDGPGEMGDALPAIDLGTGRHATQVAVGDYFTCALLDNGTVKCWGHNTSGWLGVGDLVSRGDDPGEMGDNLPAVNLGTGRLAVSISTGTAHTCAILDNAQLKCWGSGSWGKLGYGSAGNRGGDPSGMGDNLPAVALGTGRTAVAVSAGDQHTCAVLDNASLKCWGINEYGQLGYGDVLPRGDDPGEMGDALPAISLGTGRTATAVSASMSNHTCALLDNGTAKCWGINSNGKLGIDSTSTRGDQPGEMGDNLPAVIMPAGTTLTEISAGLAQTCAVTLAKTALCWGSSSFGQLGAAHSSSIGDSAGSMLSRLAPIDLGGALAKVQAAASSPAAPTNVTALAESGQAVLTWTAPVSDGGTPVSSYRIESSATGSTWTVAVASTGTTSTGRTVNGLVNGTAVRFRVSALNAAGVGVPSLASEPVTPLAPVPPAPPVDPPAAPPAPPAVPPAPPAAPPAPPSQPATPVDPTSGAYMPLAPGRLADTRGPGTVDGRFAGDGIRPAGSVYRIQVAGRAGVPADATAAVLNLAITESQAAGYATIFPCTDMAPTAANINFDAGETTSNAAVAKLDAAGHVCVFVSAGTHLVLDANGAYPKGSAYTPLSPGRLLDTRGLGTVDALPVTTGVRPAGSVLELQVAGRAGVPADATAAVLNLAITEPQAAGYATIFPCTGTGTVPTAANINFDAGETTSNAVVAKLDPLGRVCVFVSATTHLVIDANGAHGPNSGLLPLAPGRLADSRGPGTVDGLFAGDGIRSANSVYTIQVAGRAGVPADATSAVLNLAITQPQGPGYATIFPCTDTVPTAANINFDAGETTSNAVVAKLDGTGRVCVYVSATTHLVVDANGATRAG